MSRISLFLLLVILFTGCQSSPDLNLTHIEGLGSIDFPNSGNEAAQEPFYRGVLLLHSFEFPYARDAFREAQEADSLFALAYWGEAVAHNYPLWKSKDVDEARAVLARMDSVGALAPSHREQMYLDAVRALYMEGTKEEQDLAYMAAMKSLHEAHPEDMEAQALYSLSILGSTDGDRDFDVYAEAASFAEPVFEANPNHPGAAHYIIHSYDDPDHADLGLAAANAYSEIAPGAAHAQHMTTHIFLAQGDWPRVIANNQRAMDVQNEQRVSEDRPPVRCGHYSSWLHYGHLQMENWDEATALMDLCHEQVKGSEQSGAISYFEEMRAHHIWVSGMENGIEAWPMTEAELGREWSLWTYAATNAYVALRDGDLETAKTWSEKVTDEWGGEITAMLLDGLIAIQEGDTDGGLAMLQEASEMEAAQPFAFGPPSIPIPSHEVWGTALLDLGRTDEAAEVLATAESRTPGRLTLTRARASMESGG